VLDVAERRRSGRSAVCLLLAVLSVTLPRFAGAALGADEASVEADRLQMQGVLHTSSAPLYTIHEIQAPSGTTVREFISTAGVVFAVAWKGPFLPDLRQALGSYFEPYRMAVHSKGAARTHANVELPGLVVHSGGHQRAFSGRAYLPALVPPGVAVSDLR
jgi:hypothetical protein